MKSELGSLGTGVVIVYWSQFYGIWLEGQKKITMNLSEDSLFPGQDVNSEPAE
jgi:hypothetical protein